MKKRLRKKHDQKYSLHRWAPVKEVERDLERWSRDEERKLEQEMRAEQSGQESKDE